MPIKFRGFVLASFLLCSAVLAEDVPVYYNSESSSVEFTSAGEPKEIILQDKVKIIFKDITVFCEKAKLNRLTGDITAEGPLTVEAPEGIFKAEYLTYNTNEERGIISNPSFSMPPLYGKAEKVCKEEGRVILERGYITTCDLKNPHFRISAERMEYVKDDYIRAERMRLTFGRKFSVFYFPRFTIDARTKEAPVTISPGYSSRIGETADFIFSHRLGKDSDSLLKERLSIGRKGLGFGLETLSRKEGFGGSAFAYKRWDKDWLEPGGYFELGRSYDSRTGPGRIIIDWRWMYGDEFFNDFFREEFLTKSKTYNYLSCTHDFTPGILNINVRHNAGEDFLKVEKLPELQFYTPPVKIGNSPVFIENDMRLTNFHKEDKDHFRMMDILTLEGRKNAGHLTLTPYATVGGIDYRSDSCEDKFNLLREFGAKASMSLKKNHGRYTEYFVPSFSFFYRGLDYEPGEIESFDRIEKLSDGKFAGMRTEWFFTGDEGYLGRISLENIYSLDREKFEESNLKYDVKITPQFSIEGENEWDITNTEYTFGVNDLVFHSGKYDYSVGNRYDDESGTSGIMGRFMHTVNENWRYALGLQYDINEGSFTRKSVEVWRKLHCWELNFKVSADEKDYSFYVTAYPILF